MNYSEFIDSLTSPYRNLLGKLTSSGPDNPPGYLYNELVDLIRCDLSKLNQVEDYLINKLSRKEPYVKIKCLKLLKQLCIKFPTEFIRPKVTQSHQVYECKTYRAPHDLFQGDHLSKLVRSEFEQLIQVVCSYDTSTNPFTQSKDKMVGFGSSQYNYNQNNYNQNSYNPGMGNSSFQNQPHSSHSRTYGNSGMVGFGNPNMPQTPPNHGNSFSSFASNFTPTVEELKNAGNNALRLISNAANKYLPSDFVEKFERVSNAITTTATEQFEKYLGSRTSFGKSSSTLNNSMYSSQQSNYSSQGFGYNSCGYTAPQPSSQPFGNQYSSQYQPSQYSIQSNTQRPTVQPGLQFSNQNYSYQSSVQSNTQQSSIEPVVKASNVPSLDLFGQSEPVMDKFTVPGMLNSVKSSLGEKETLFVKEMLTFTGIKVSPSPRLVEEYLERMKGMDQSLVVDELLKHLNVRSSKWQTHFRILCILESLLLKANLDQSVLTNLKKNALPIFNKCKSEPQLTNKASKVISLLTNLDDNLFTEPVTDTADLFNTQTSTKNVEPPVESKDELDLFFNDTTVQKTEPVKKTEEKDLFDLDSLSFENPSKPEAPKPKQKAPVSNIDNNLDLFDNTDVSNTDFNFDLI